ncbi:BrnT family toxin [Duganella sp. FT80W]|uniref:BrnT family toxin n=1 Tax=Duganella guangzhouensis TaxID=2666084 RepID=A0A6I2KYS2_9BURK|nr:BrnT family toxin [Duganella guangzhouensis]
MRFTWDSRKAKANLRAHGVSFDEASTAFDDPHGKLKFDLAHSDDEERFVQLGRSNKGRLLLVCHCYRGEAVRIISARKALPIDEMDYFER